MEILTYAVVAIIALLVITTGIFYYLHYRSAEKYKDLYHSPADEVEPEKPESVVLNVHSARHVVTKVQKPVAHVLEIDSAKHEVIHSTPILKAKKKTVLGMAKLTENQRMRVVRHHKRRIKHGKVAE